VPYRDFLIPHMSMSKAHPSYYAAIRMTLSENPEPDTYAEALDRWKSVRLDTIATAEMAAKRADDIELLAKCRAARKQIRAIRPPVEGGQ
jgi:hypothetical protein